MSSSSPLNPTTRLIDEFTKRIVDESRREE
jgi:hypothetical protein